jgi:hypothetical protein
VVAQAARWHGGRMLSSRTSRIALLTVLGALLAVASIPAVASAAQRYASPTGSDPHCSAASPCDIKQAMEYASSGDEVIVAPGDYPLTGFLAASHITVHGVPGQPRPRLLFDNALTPAMDLYDATLRYVEVVRAPGDQGIALGATHASLDQVIVRGTAQPDWQTVWTDGTSTIRNSIVVAPGPGGTAIMTYAAGATATGTFRNVTAVATASNGVAIRAQATGAVGFANVLARNAIARGGPGGASFKAYADNSGATAKITVDYSNWLGESTVGAKASIVEGAGNQSADPAFVNAASGDYRQAAGSPTIDAGLDEAIDGAFDVDGDPRQLFGIDIGADEFVVAPAATTGPASAITDRSATLIGNVDAKGAPTSYHFEYGPTTAYGSTTPTAVAGSGGTVTAAATISALRPATTYHYRLVATNAGGVTKGPDRIFTTASPPPTPTSPPPVSSSTTQPSTTQAPATTSTRAFAGVKPVSTRLTYRRRVITLKLSCAAGTVDRCSGRTKLTARGKATTGTARSVTLGRASFSIAPGTRAKVKVRVSRVGRQLLGRARRVRGKDSNVARDGAGRSKTTVAAVTIRRRRL